MTRDQFLRRLRRLARERMLDFELDASRGKGSHYFVRVGDRETVVQSKLTPARIARIMRQLALDPGAL